jgi:uncharacterized protein (DUF885 family)
MMKKIRLIVLLTVCVFSQTSIAEKSSATAKALDFNTFKNTFLDEFWSYSPDWATYVGYYKYDDKLIVPDDKSRAQKRKFLVRSLAALNDFDQQNLSTSNATDFSLIENQLQSDLWYLDEFRRYTWDPSAYNVANIFGLIMNTEYKSVEDRLAVVATRLDQVPAYYAAAMKTIDNPTLEHTRLAIDQNLGALSVFDELIPGFASNSRLSKQSQDELITKLDAASDAINAYIEWLSELQEGLSKSDQRRDFRIGKELYEKKFGYDIVSNFSAYDLYQRAILEKDKLHAEMARITTDLWPKYFKDQAMPDEKLVAIKQMIDRLAVKHIDRESFVDEIRRQMPIIQKFMDDNELLDSDPSRPLVVRETPKYQRGIAGASVDAPGPYDATANTYYNVTPLDDYTPEQAESYLREYNHWILQVLNIHEAIPGHYTQLMHANKSASKIKSVFGNGAMIEGWAVYSERMMLEQGYGNNEPELWLMYAKWNMRVVVNTILDYSVQVLGMQYDAAMDMLLNEAFQEKTEAEGKWRRVTLSQVQLTSYFNGYAEIYAFREELKQKMGEGFNLRDFHNKFLSYGNAPVPVIRNLMLQELGLTSD